MTAPRTRRLAILPLAALAVTLPALPALGSTSYMAGCNVAPGDYSESLPHEAPLEHTGPWTSTRVDPQGETLRASASMTWNGTPVGDQCAVNAGYRDAITVVGAGLPAGTMVEVTAVIRLAGEMTATGSGSPHHVAESDTDASYSLRERFADFGTPDVLHVRGDGQAYDREVNGAGEDGSTFSHAIEVAGEQVDSSFDRDYVDGLRPFDTGTRTATFAVPVGTVLDVVANVGTVATSYDGAGDARAAVDEFSVKLTTSTPGAALDRGDGPAPEPEPEPEPVRTALDAVDDAQAALTGYGLPKGIATALRTKLAHAERDLLAEADATDDLTAFANQVGAQRGKKLTTEQADALAALAAEARELLGG